ncbi:MAG: ATP-binding protein [Lachnospiraceae bacterium]|nr:ATP-binding protein [Lachnospiraceae bacterium]
MFAGRSKELKFLEDNFNQKESRFIVLYGKRGVGKTELLRVFSREKKVAYYCARECSAREQLFSLGDEWKEKYGVSFEEYNLKTILSKAAIKSDVIILDEFNNMVKNNPEFQEALQFILKPEFGKKVMVIVSSSSVNWVENDMVNAVGELATSISAFYKVKEFTFTDIMRRFPNYSLEDCAKVYAIAGGMPAYLNYWSDKRSVKENIMGLFLHKDGRLYREMENFMRTELRELALYNTILASLASGRTKLNDIYERTGFSRAKISVYIKNLIALDIVEKVFSVDTDGKENTKKGLYCIKDHFVHFWFRFVYPNLSSLEERKMEEVYNNKIEPALDAYMSIYFKDIVAEYMGLLSNHGKLPFAIKQVGSWYGKNGNIDLVGQGENGSVFVGICKWDREPMSESDFEDALYLIMQAEIEPDYYYLYSKSGFGNGLEAKAKYINNMVLTSLEDM